MKPRLSTFTFNFLFLFDCCRNTFQGLQIFAWRKKKMTDTTNSNTHTVNIMKYACVHFFKEGNQFDIVESSKLEEIGDQCICQWKDKQYPVKVLGYGGK